MLDLNRIPKSESKITDNLIHKQFYSIDRTVVMLEVTLKRQVNGKNRPCIIEKSFRNNYDGNQDLEKAIKEFDSEEKVKKYFGLN